MTSCSSFSAARKNGKWLWCWTCWEYLKSNDCCSTIYACKINMCSCISWVRLSIIKLQRLSVSARVCMWFDCMVSEIIYHSYVTTATGKINNVLWWKPALTFVRLWKFATDSLSYSGTKVLIGTQNVGWRTCHTAIAVPFQPRSDGLWPAGMKIYYSILVPSSNWRP